MKQYLISDQLPRFKLDKRIHDSSLMIFRHVLVHGGVVPPDVPLRGSVRNRPEAERRRVCVRVLKLMRRRERRRGGMKQRGNRQSVKESRGHDVNLHQRHSNCKYCVFHFQRCEYYMSVMSCTFHEKIRKEGVNACATYPASVSPVY